MTASQRLRIEQSEIRQSINAILSNDEINDEGRAQMATLTKRGQDLEIELRASIMVEGEVETRALEHAPDAQMRERVELRQRASLTNFILSRVAGRTLTGAEAELQQAAGVSGIPSEILDTETRQTRQGVETRADVASGVPGTVGLNLDSIRPAVFANSIIPRLGVQMPRIGSGTYATATIDTVNTAAAAYLAGVDADSVATTFTVGTSGPKRISARLTIRAEDVAQVGQENYESSLRENLTLQFSSELDDQGLNGDGVAPNLTGLFGRLAAAVAPVGVADFLTYASQSASMIDGLWAMTLEDCMIVCGVETYRLASTSFQSTAGSAGELSAAAYARMHTGGMWTNSRMPDPATNVQNAIGYRMGRAMMGGMMEMRTAVCGIYNEIDITDIYTGSARAETNYTMHTLLTDILVVQPDAYQQLAYQLA